MIEVRRAESDADFEGWIRVKRAVLPNESAWTVEDFRTRHARRPAPFSSRSSRARSSAPGSVGRSDDPQRGYVAPRVHPDARRRGVGHGAARPLARVRRVARARPGQRPGRRPGIEGVRRALRLRRERPRRSSRCGASTARSRSTPIPDGVEVVTIAERPELLAAAYPLAQGRGLHRPGARRCRSRSRSTTGSATRRRCPKARSSRSADGGIVGYSGLMAHDNDGRRRGRSHGRRARLAPARARNGAQAARARLGCGDGFSEVRTWTQRGNEGMRAVNERLGYAYRDVALTMMGSVPLEPLR